MRVIFFDLAHSTGWAFGASDGKRTSGTCSFPRTGEQLGPFMVAARHAFTGLLNELEPDLVGFESPILRTATTITVLRKLYSLAAKLEEVCWDLATECREANLGEIRRHFLGKGYPKKSETAKRMVFERCKLLGWSPANLDEADALAGLDYLLALQTPAAAINRTPLFERKLV